MTPDWQLAIALLAVWVFLSIIGTLVIGSLIHAEEDYEREAIEVPRLRNHVEAYLVDPSAAHRSVADEAQSSLIRCERFAAWLERNGMSLGHDPTAEAGGLQATGQAEHPHGASHGSP